MVSSLKYHIIRVDKPNSRLPRTCFEPFIKAKLLGVFPSETDPMAWYCVTKAKLFFLFSWSVFFLFLRCISERVRVIKYCSHTLCLKCFWILLLVLRIWSPLIKPLLTPNRTPNGWQDEKYASLLKCFSELKMCSYVKNWHAFKLFLFVQNCIQEWNFVFRDFLSKFI